MFHHVDAIFELGPDLRPGAGQVGIDDDGVVQVLVAADGGVSSVEVSSRWRERLHGVDALAAAVLAAHRQALLKRMAARLVNGAGEVLVARPVDGPASTADRLDPARVALGAEPAGDRLDPARVALGAEPAGDRQGPARSGERVDVGDREWREGVRAALEVSYRRIAS